MNCRCMKIFYLALNLFFFICILLNLGISDYCVAMPCATITGNYSDHVKDYDFLIVDIGVNVYNPGEYSLTGSLYDINNEEVAWSIDHENFSMGSHIMRLNFDTKTIAHGRNDSLHLSNLKLTSGSSDNGLDICDFLPQLYYPITSNFANYVKQISTEKQLTGIGYGDLLLKITIMDTVSVLSGSYSYDIVGIHVPPISSTFSVSYPPITKNLSGYAYDTDSIYIPNMPNNFSVSVTEVKNLNIGLKKQQGSYENSSTIYTDKYTRTWISTRAEADKDYVATIESYLISPGIYQAKIFGDAAENATKVNLTMTLIKKVIVNGPFNLSINTTGFPSGKYLITAKALNGTFSLDELAIGDPSIPD